MNATIELLSKTSQLVKIYTSKSPITELSDTRLAINRDVLHWFQEWNSTKERPKAFLTAETYEDLCSMIRATENYVTYRLTCTPTAHVCLHRLNSDVVENFFSQQRGIMTGCNTNPTILQYGKNVNSIILSQETLSTKRNAATDIAVGGAYPLKLLTKQSFRKKDSM